MKKYESLKKQKQAMKLYLEGMAKKAIAKELNVHFTTIYTWHKQFNWEEKLEEISQKVDKKIIESVEEMKEKHIEIINATIVKYADKLKDPNFKVSASEVARMLQHELELRVPKTIAQYNFMKKETNVNLNFPELLRAIRNGTGI